jgi:hypothetical protein
MVLTGVLFVLFLGSCWVYCLTDAALTPAATFRRVPKGAWVGLIAATFIVGAVAWLFARSACRQPGAYARSVDWPAAEASLARHPAGRKMASRGPDDDAEFLRALDHIIRGS